MNLYKKNTANYYQIRELWAHVNYLDERIAKYKKTGRSTKELKESRDYALRTIKDLDS